METRSAEHQWQRVAWSMAAGAVYDSSFALMILLFTRPAARMLRLEVPEDRLYLHLNGVLLLLLAALYALPAVNPVRYQGVVAVAALGRFLGSLFFFRVAWTRGGSKTFLLLALADLAFGLAHGVLLASARARDRAQVHETQGS